MITEGNALKTLIVYYSMSGNCEFAANSIAEKLGADILRIEPEKAYPDSGFKKFLYGGRSAVMGEMPPLVPYKFEPEQYGRVILGFPVWAANPAPPMRTFIRDNLEALKAKRLAVFACQGGSGANKAFSKLKKKFGLTDFEAELVLIDPKSDPKPGNAELIGRFCLALSSDDE